MALIISFVIRSSFDKSTAAYEFCKSYVEICYEMH